MSLDGGTLAFSKHTQARRDPPAGRAGPPRPCRCPPQPWDADPSAMNDFVSPSMSISSRPVRLCSERRNTCASVQRNRGADRRWHDLDGRAGRNEDLVKAGVLPAAERLQASSKGARIKCSGGKHTTIII